MAIPLTDFIRHSSVGGDLQHKITYGVPEIGWSGDPWLTLCWNKLESRWEIWDEKHEKPSCVHRSRPMDMGELPNINQLCAHLRDHDIHKVSMADQMRKVDEHNAAIVAASAVKHRERQSEALQKAYFYMNKEVGHLH